MQSAFAAPTPRRVHALLPDMTSAHTLCPYRNYGLPIALPGRLMLRADDALPHLPMRDWCRPLPYDDRIQRLLTQSDAAKMLPVLPPIDPMAATKISLSQGFPQGVKSASSFELNCNRYSFGKKLFTCAHCRYVTDRKNNLKRHVATMHQNCDKALECCGVAFGNKASLRDHVVIFHSGGYLCRYCGRNFCRKALLKRHLTVHSGQKDHVCELCDYATSHKSNLERHRRIHDRHDAGSAAGAHAYTAPCPNGDDADDCACVALRSVRADDGRSGETNSSTSLPVAETTRAQRDVDRSEQFEASATDIVDVVS